MLELRQMAMFLKDDEETFTELLADKTNKDLLEQKKHRENELQKSVARHKSVENLYERLYEDNISGKVSDEWFMQLSHKYEVERMKPKEKISALHREISELDGISQCYGWTITLIGAAFLIHCPIKFWALFQPFAVIRTTKESPSIHPLILVIL